MRERVLAEIKRRLEVCEKAVAAPWTIAGGNDADDTPLLQWQGRQALAFRVYSLKAGADVAMVPIPWDLNMDTSAFIAASREWTPAALRFAEREVERHMEGGLHHELCVYCVEAWPCETIRDAAECFGVKE